MKRCIAILVCWIPVVTAALLLSAVSVRAEMYAETYRSPFGTARGVATDPTDGSCWAEVGDSVYRLAADGTVLTRVRGCEEVSALAVDASDGTCWLLDARYPTQLIQLSPAGAELRRFDAHGAGGRTIGTYMRDALAVNPADGSLWVGGYDGVVHLSADGALLWSGYASHDIMGLSVDPRDGSCWVADYGCWDSVVDGWTDQGVVHLASDGSELWRGTGFEAPRVASVNPVDGSCWVAARDMSSEAQFVAHLAADGAELWRSTGGWWAEALSVNPSDGSCWATDISSGRLVHLAEDGSQLWASADSSLVGSLSVDPADGSCWVASSGSGEVTHIAASGDELTRLGFLGHGIEGVAVNGTDHSVWVTETSGARVGHLAQDGSVLWLTEGFYGAFDVAVNSSDGSCWVAGHSGYGEMRLNHLAPDGSELWSGAPFLDESGRVTAIDVNQADGSCWASTNHEAVHLAEDGTELWRAHGFVCALGLAVNSADGSCWVADAGGYDDATGQSLPGGVFHYAADGSELWHGTGFAGPQSVCLNPADGSCWVADTYYGEVVHLGSDGSELLRVGVGPPYAVAVDTRDGSCWAATDEDLVRVSASGRVVSRALTGGHVLNNGLAVDPADGSVWAGLYFLGQLAHFVPGRSLSLMGDRGSVRVSGVSHPLPWTGGFLDGTGVTLQAEPAAEFISWYGDLTGSQNPATVVMNSDLSIGVQFTEHALDLTCAADPTVVFPGGTTQLTATATDTFGHGVAEYVWEAFEDLRAAQVGSLEGGRPVEVVVQGSYAYSAAEGAFAVYDLSDPGSPELAAALDVPGGAETVAVSGHYAYVGVAGGGRRGFQVVDIANPVAPVIVGGYWSECGCRRPAIAAAGNYVYFSADDLEQPHFLGIFDVSDPSHPWLVGRGPLDPCTCDLTVSGNYVYSVGGGGALDVVDVSEPDAPVAAGSLDLGVFGIAVAAADTHVYVGGSSLAVLDVSDPAHPVLVGSPSPLSTAADLAVDGAYAYLSDADGLRIVDVSAPGAPAVVGACPSPLGQTGVAVGAGYAYVAAPSGLAAVSVANPSAPTVAGSAEAWGGAGLIAASGHYAYVPSRDGLRVLDLAAAGGPAEASVASPGTGFAAVTVAGGYAYASAAGAPESGLVIFDLSDPSHPARIGAWTEPAQGDTILGSLGAIAVSGNYAFVTETCYGIVVFDVTDRTHPVWVTRPLLDSPPGCQTSLALVGDILYIATRAYPAVAYLMDVSVPTDPVLIGTITDLWGCCGLPMAASGNRLYLGTMDGLLIYDASDPRAPVAIGSYQSELPVRDVAVSGGDALLTMGYSGGDASLRLLDISDPAAPALLAGYPGHGGGWHRPSVAISPGYLCFADAGWGITAFDRGLITGAGVGSFSPSPYVPNPTYTAPSNTGGRDETIALRVRATCDDPDEWSALTASASCTVTVDGAVTLTAGANPAEGGSVTGGGSYAYGATATVSAVPAEGWAFQSWSGPVADPQAATTTVLMDGDESVTANFVRSWFEDDDPAIAYLGTWVTMDHPLATAGHARYSTQTTARASFTFTGTGLKWHTAKGPQMGKAQVWIDGVGPTLVDLYQRSLQTAVISKLGLARKEHTIIVQVSGRKNWASKGTMVTVDAFEVVP